MKAYSGSEGRPVALAAMREKGIGLLVTAYQWRNPTRGVSWILDNGAFSAWRKNEPFPARKFEKALGKVPAAHRPDFAVIPDVVAGGLASLSLSEAWLPRLPHGWPWYVAVQDGMSFEHVEPFVTRVAGVFVGGSMDWKLRNAEAWIAWSHERGLRTHVGRVGTVENLLWAERIGADSVDSTSWARNDSYGNIDAAKAQRRLASFASAEFPSG